jgi:aromatic-L-amino-acid/L-tryptophan decarboxylase
MLWSTSPACTELETQVLDWLVPMLGLPEKFLSTSSGRWRDSGHCVQRYPLRGARRARAFHKFASNHKGCDGRLVAYCSTQTHSSIEKAMKIAGMGSDNLRHIEVDENFAMRAEALRNKSSAISRPA